MTALKTRKPTGEVVAPLVLLEGGEKSGKSWAAATLSASPKVGRTLWLDLGEGAGDEYAAIPGARYELIEHDGSYRSILGQIVAARAEAERAAKAGELPVVLVVDSMTALWDLLKDWIDDRARRTERAQKILARDPNAEITITTDLWNDATGRWRAVMTKLMTFPGPVIMTARGKEVVEIGSDGKPTKNRDYRVEGQKGLAYDASVWVRMTRDDGASIVGARSVHLGIQPKRGQRPKPLPDDWTLESLIFDDLRYEPGPVRDLRVLGAQAERRADAEEMREQALTTSVTVEGLRTLYSQASNTHLLDAPVMDAEGKAELPLGELIKSRAAALAPKPVPSEGAAA